MEQIANNGVESCVSHSVSLSALRRKVAAIERRPPSDPLARVPLGVEAVDAALGGGIARARLHELFAAEPADTGAASGFAAMLAARLGGDGPIVWLREEEAQRKTRLHAPGLMALGLDPARVLLGIAADPLMLLRAASEIVRCDEVAVAVIELWRSPRTLDLTASRRLAVAAEGSGVTALMLRIDAAPAPSAAHTRWRVAAASSRPLEANAPGAPAFNLELIRQRGGAEGLRWRLEWDRDAHLFRDTPLPGAMVSVAEHRSAAA
jgi:protein ImuA